MEKWQIYLQEANTQIEFAKRLYTSYQMAEANAAITDIFLHLHHFVIHATNIDKILDAKPEQSSQDGGFRRALFELRDKPRFMRLVRASCAAARLGEQRKGVRSTAAEGALFFGYFRLGKQTKVARLSGRARPNQASSHPYGG
jgi:hypothetical protein